jgi:hypothetical protein
MPNRPLNDAKHWRDRATELRALAATNSDVEAARIMYKSWQTITTSSPSVRTSGPQEVLVGCQL